MTISESNNRPWSIVISDFAAQLQLFVSGMWDISFSLVTSATRIESLKDIIDQFNAITLDPIVPMMLWAESTLYIDVPGNMAYVLKPIGGLNRPVESVEMVLHYSGCRYIMTTASGAADSDATSPYVRFHLALSDENKHGSEGEDESEEASYVTINTKKSKLCIKEVVRRTSIDVITDLLNDEIDPAGDYCILWSCSNRGVHMCTRLSNGSSHLTASIQLHVEFSNECTDGCPTLLNKAGTLQIVVTSE
jgi:hypothetical protein